MLLDYRTRWASFLVLYGQNGISANVDGHDVSCGNDKLMESLGIEFTPCHSVGTIIHVAIDGAYVGHIVISDVVKPHPAEAVRT